MERLQKIPHISVIDPERFEELQEWANQPNNEMILHNAAVEALRKMVENTRLESVVLVKFAWEDEVYAELSLGRGEVQEAAELSIEYYVEQEAYEAAAYSKVWLDRFQGFSGKDK